MNSLACLCPGVLFQYEALDLASQAEILDSHFLFVIPQYGSGPTRLIEAPALASKSLTIASRSPETYRPENRKMFLTELAQMISPQPITNKGTSARSVVFRPNLSVEYPVGMQEIAAPMGIRPPIQEF